PRWCLRVAPSSASIASAGARSPVHTPRARRAPPRARASTAPTLSLAASVMPASCLLGAARARDRGGRRHGSLDCPCSRGHRDRAVEGGHEAGFQGVSYPVPGLVGQGREVGWRRALLTQERPPVVLEVPKDSRDLDRTYRDRGQPGAPEKLLEWTRLAEGEALRLIDLRIT